MAVAMAGFTMNDAITKAVSSEMNFGQMMLVRGLVAIALIAALAWHQGAMRPLRTLMVKPVALRVVGEIGGTMSFMAAIVHLPLANTSAIFQALPLAITFGAALMFGEPVGWRRWLAIAAGFVGVLIIVRPGVDGLQPVFAAGADLGGVLRRAAISRPGNSRADPVAVHYPGDDGDDHADRSRHPCSARRLDAAIAAARSVCWRLPRFCS